MHPTQRFAALVNGPEDQLALDEAALLIAAHAYPDLDVEAERAELDRLAIGPVAGDLESWRRHMFVELEFSGNVASYFDPRNSYLNDVVRRRMGLPITLSVVGIELARRVDVHLAGVGMPGHFLLRSDAGAEPVFIDPFDGGRRLDRDGCRARFHAVNGESQPFLDAYLDPVGSRAILARMLANLKSIFAHHGDVDSLEWVLALRLAIPGVPLLERRDLARLRASAGRYGEAADELEDLASALPDLADSLQAESVALRARLN